MLNKKGVYWLMENESGFRKGLLVLLPLLSLHLERQVGCSGQAVGSSHTAKAHLELFLFLAVP